MLRSYARNLGSLSLLALTAACSGAGATNAGRKPAAGGSQPAAGTRATSNGRPVAAPAAASRTIPERDLALSQGTTLELRSRTALSSRTNHAGDPVTAILVAPAYADSALIIPAGSEFLGTIEAIAPAPSPHQQGRLELAFTQVRIGDELHAIHARVISVATHLKGRGVTGGTVAKVGGGALIGGIVGHLVGRSTAGTLVGAAAGGAAGGVVANATRNLDIVLDRGAPIRLELAEPFVAQVASRQ